MVKTVIVDSNLTELTIYKQDDTTLQLCIDIYNSGDIPLGGGINLDYNDTLWLIDILTSLANKIKPIIENG